MIVDQCDSALDYQHRLMIIHLAAGLHNPCKIWHGINDEPGVDRDTMASDARPGSQHVHPRMAVGKVDGLPHVYFIMIADEGQFIGERYVGVPIRIFSQLHQLGCPGCRCHTRPPDKLLVESLSASGAHRGYSADAAVVVDELREYTPW